MTTLAEQFPSATDDRLIQPLHTPLPIGIVADDSLPGIPPRHDMVDGTLEFDSEVDVA